MFVCVIYIYTHTHTYIYVHTQTYIAHKIPPAQVSFSPAVLSTTVDATVNIAAEVQFSSCQGSSKSSIAFIWSQIATDDGRTAPMSPEFDIASVSSSAMYIPPYTLTAGRSYRLSLTLIPLEDPGSYTQVTYDFSVGVLPLVASIQGGDVINIGSDSDLVLDATSSSDPNVEQSLEQGLTYTWMCILDDGAFSQVCLDKDGLKLALAPGQVLTVRQGTLDPSPSEEMPYTFILQMSKPGRSVHRRKACFCPLDMCLIVPEKTTIKL